MKFETVIIFVLFTNVSLLLITNSKQKDTIVYYKELYEEVHKNYSDHLEKEYTTPYKGVFE